MPKVLVVEDEKIIRELMVFNLRRSGYDTIEAETGEMGLEMFDREAPAAVLLDINLPGIDGLEVCRSIREKNASTGIIMVTARGQENDRIGGLKSGADDYITKPFSTAELIARLDALCRRMTVTDEMSDKSQEQCIKSGPFTLMLKHKRLIKMGTQIDITQVDHAILLYLMRNCNRDISRHEIYASVWSPDETADMKIVDVNIRRLRMKIEDDPSNPIYIQTVWGVGYRWTAETKPGEK